MQDILGESLRKLRQIRIRRTRMIAILLLLSFVVSLDVFWVLRQPGLTLAGDADCRVVEHTHDDGCNALWQNQHQQQQGRYQKRSRNYSGFHYLYSSEAAVSPVIFRNSLI